MQVPQLTTNIMPWLPSKKENYDITDILTGLSLILLTLGISNHFLATDTYVRVFFTLEGGSCKKSMHITQQTNLYTDHVSCSCRL